MRHSVPSENCPDKLQFLYSAAEPAETSKLVWGKEVVRPKNEASRNAENEQNWFPWSEEKHTRAHTEVSVRSSAFGGFIRFTAIARQSQRAISARSEPFDRFITRTLQLFKSSLRFLDIMPSVKTIFSGSSDMRCRQRNDSLNVVCKAKMQP